MLGFAWHIYWLQFYLGSLLQIAPTACVGCSVIRLTVTNAVSLSAAPGPCRSQAGGECEYTSPAPDPASQLRLWSLVPQARSLVGEVNVFCRKQPFCWDNVQTFKHSDGKSEADLSAACAWRCVLLCGCRSLRCFFWTQKKPIWEPHDPWVCPFVTHPFVGDTCAPVSVYLL